MRTTLQLSQDHDLSVMVSGALVSRGVTADEAADYLSPSLRRSLPDPYCLTDMDKGTERLARAVLNGESVGVFGDYDVDGTTASAILHLYFRAIGLDIPVYLPDRLLEGYGPSVEAFRSLKDDGVRLVVTVDCGASAHTVIETAAREGLDTVVVDHHLMSGPPPEQACAVINPNRPDDTSGLGNLSAAGVAFMLIVALNKALREQGFFKDRKEPNLLEFLDLTALGLVCDVMEMRGLTRILVAQGLKVLGQNGNPGLKSLAAQAGSKGQPTVYDLGFLIGPRINAAGRIGHARLAFELLTSPDADRRAELAEKLHVMNAQRQEIERAVQESAIAEIEQRGLSERSVIIVAGDGWHPGVIGIVAGRLKEKYDRPVIVIGFEADVGKGSGRSISGVDLGHAIGAAKQAGLLSAGGGHAMAAGLTITRDQVGAFETFLNERLGACVTEALQSQLLKVDAVAAPTAVSRVLVDEIERVGPFGPGNPEPTFVLSDMRVTRCKVVGKGHLSCELVSRTGDIVRAIAFRAADEPLGAMLQGHSRVHVSGKLRADTWRGGQAVQMQISDAAIS